MKTNVKALALLMLMAFTGVWVSCTDTELDENTETAITIEQFDLQGTDHGDSGGTGAPPPPTPPGNGEN